MEKESIGIRKTATCKRTTPTERGLKGYGKFCGFCGLLQLRKCSQIKKKKKGKKKSEVGLADCVCYRQ